MDGLNDIQSFNSRAGEIKMMDRITSVGPWILLAFLMVSVVGVVFAGDEPISSRDGWFLVLGAVLFLMMLLVMRRNEAGQESIEVAIKKISDDPNEAIREYLRRDLLSDKTKEYEHVLLELSKDFLSEAGAAMSSWGPVMRERAFPPRTENAHAQMMNLITLILLGPSEYKGTTTINELNDGEKRRQLFIASRTFPEKVKRLLILEDKSHLMKLDAGALKDMKEWNDVFALKYIERKAVDQRNRNFGVYGTVAVGLYDDVKDENVILVDPAKADAFREDFDRMWDEGEELTDDILSVTLSRKIQ